MNMFKMNTFKMNIFTQLVLIVGRITSDRLQVLGTGFVVQNDGYIATTHHVAGSDDSNLVVLAPHISDINAFQNLSDTSCRPVAAKIHGIDPIRDLVILKAEFSFNGKIPKLGSFDDDLVGDPVGIFGFPHCIEGRRALTFQKAEIGAKVLFESNGVTSKHAVINTQARPGQSGSLIFSPKDQSISGVLMGAWASRSLAMTISFSTNVGEIDPRELHQTTHCISAEYLKEML